MNVDLQPAQPRAAILWEPRRPDPHFQVVWGPPARGPPLFGFKLNKFEFDHVHFDTQFTNAQKDNVTGCVKHCTIVRLHLI